VSKFEQIKECFVGNKNANRRKLKTISKSEQAIVEMVR